jgi:hypothetical protein
MVKAPHPDGDECRLITAVIGIAASAAADFLALGDYAIAYPHTQILYHGSRTDTAGVVTYESATSLASSLQQTNEFFARRLAGCAFDRFMLRLTQLHKEFSDFRNNVSKVPSQVISPIVAALRQKLGPDKIRLLHEAEGRQQRITALTLSVGRHLSKFKRSEDFSNARFEAEMLKAILGFKLKGHKKDTWTLSDTGLEEVTDDFKLLVDFHFGSQKRSVKRLVRLYGPLLLGDSEKADYDNLAVNGPDKEEWLREKIEHKIQPLWYFMVSLCRRLQSADYDLSPEEAYWLGLVDEVPGSDLPNLRVFVENKNRPAPQSD